MIKRASLFICLLFAAHSIALAGVILAENFDDVTTLPGAGWVQVNNSAPVGTHGWFQPQAGSGPLVFSAQSGPANSYIAADFLNADQNGGNISSWLLTPELSLCEGAIIFYTRSNAAFADRLELRLSVNGASRNVGSTDSSLGDFTTLLLDINQALTVPGYPAEWTQYSASLSSLGLAANATGRYAFRYLVPNTLVNGDYIGIDTVSISAAPEPATMLNLALGFGGLVILRKVGGRRRQ